MLQLKWDDAARLYCRKGHRKPRVVWDGGYIACSGEFFYMRCEACGSRWVWRGVLWHEAAVPNSHWLWGWVDHPTERIGD